MRSGLAMASSFDISFDKTYQSGSPCQKLSLPPSSIQAGLHLPLERSRELA